MTVASTERTETCHIDQVVHTHGPRLFRAALSLLRDENEAHDAVQDAWLSALRSNAVFEGRAQISTWLHRIVVNAALMRLRSRRSRITPADLDEVNEPADPACKVTLDQLEHRELTHEVRSLIDQLPARHRDILRLRDLAELDSRATACYLGITENAVKVRLHRARKALREVVLRRIEGGSRTPPYAIPA